jgi:preprotein translocase subunit SecF
MQTTLNDSVPCRFHFLKYRYVWLGISVLYLVIGVAAYFIKGGFRYNSDVTGGTEVRVSFEKALDIGALRQAMSNHGWKDASIQSAGTTGKEFFIRVSSSASDAGTKIKNDLSTISADNKISVDSVECVGPEVGSETTSNAIKAVLIAILVILFYIGVRFQFRFGLGAIAALIHDVLAVLVFLVLVGEPISLHVLSAILAVLGYSVHDTIVIFNRMRGNFVKLRGMSEYDIADISINQTLSRTLLTSGATLLSVLAILLLGGETLRGFALVMFVGIIVGTYSSIYIASPVMLAVRSKAKAE